MARVIKAGQGGQKPARPATRMIVDAGDKKIIDRALYQAKQDAEHILMRAEHERQAIIADGKKQSARTREEAMVRGASEAFAAAAAEALAAFRARADRYGEAADDIRALALEVVRKVLGNEPDLGPKDVERILQRGMTQLRARRRLRLQVANGRLGQLHTERPNLMKALQNEPDLVIEDVDDVSEGFARVVTEIGGALCAEETALDALSVSVNVHEQPRSQRASTGETNVNTAPKGLQALQRPSTDESLPDAAVVEDEIPDDGDDTMNMAASSERTRPRRAYTRGDDVEEIEAEEDSIGDEPTSTRRAGRGAGERVQISPGTRAATRVVPIDARKDARALPAGDSDETLRHAPMIVDEDASSEEDEDLDLFTDDAVKTPRKKR